MSKEKMYIEVNNLNCPLCGKPINQVLINRFYVSCFNKYKTTYYPIYNCDCAEKIGQIVNWYKQLSEEYSEINILNKFTEASNLAFKQALKNIGVESEE